MTIDASQPPHPSTRRPGDLVVQIITHEGCKPTPYQCTAGKWTIGVGRNLESIGLASHEIQQLVGVGYSIQPWRYPDWRYTGNGFDIGGRDLYKRPLEYEESVYLLKNDITRVTAELTNAYPWFAGLCIAQQHALIDLCFNVGLTRFAGFKKMIAAIERRNYAVAAGEMLFSKWATDVGERRARCCAKLLSAGC